MFILILVVFFVCLAKWNSVVCRDWYKINHFVLFPHFEQYYDFLKARKEIEDHAERINKMMFPKGRDVAVMELERKIEEAGWHSEEKKCIGFFTGA